MLGETWDCLVEAKKTIKFSRVLLPLRGRFNGETRETFHFVVVTTKSCSVLKIGTWLERGIAIREIRRIANGYFFTNGKEAMTNPR